MPDKRYDLVVFGATGATGRQAVRYLARRAGAEPFLSWAISGRCRDSLERLAGAFPGDIDVVVADAGDQASLHRLVTSTRVVLNMAGPFALLSEPVVRACAEQGVDYLDITGETAHVRRLIDRYHSEASQTGARIIPFCGFDSVPSDLGALLLVEYFRHRGSSTREVKGFFRGAGRLNPGTVATTVELWNRPVDLRSMEDPLLLNPADRRSREESLRSRDPRGPLYDPDIGRWVAPFFMGPINTRVVRRSRALAAQCDVDYGTSFSYQEYWDPGGPAAFFMAAGMAWGMAMYQIMARAPGAARLAAPLVRAPAGPSGEGREEGCYFRALFVGTAADGSKAWAEVSDRGDPSNGITAKLACESALALALDRDLLPGGSDRAGVLTPATGLGMHLVQRLRATGMRLACPVQPS